MCEWMSCIVYTILELVVHRRIYISFGRQTYTRAVDGGTAASINPAVQPNTIRKWYLGLVSSVQQYELKILHKLIENWNNKWNEADIMNIQIHESLFEAATLFSNRSSIGEFRECCNSYGQWVCMCSIISIWFTSWHLPSVAKIYFSTELTVTSVRNHLHDNSFGYS